MKHFLLLSHKNKKMNRIYLYLLFLISLTSCLTAKQTGTDNPTNQTYSVKIDSINLFDNSRNRKIPVAFYTPNTDKAIKNQQVIIFSHGYGKNEGGANLCYSYLTENLASKGYFVVSIQHELPTDELLAMEGDLQITRRPNWERGVENIHYVLSELKKTNPDLDYKHMTLIGHSNGGDMTVLFAHKYPDLVFRIISMDNRRMPLPKVSIPKIYTLRSNDYPADEGVLPTKQEQEKYEITVQFIPINHSNMDNDATTEERKIINNYIEKYLNEK
jgi:predicted esterase